MSAKLEIALHEVSVRRAGRLVLREICLQLQTGERWALIGGNGAGKTQLLKLLATDVWPTPNGRERLSYRQGGRLIDRRRAKRLLAYLGAERQDKYARYGWNLTVGELIATGIHGTDLLLGPITAAQRRRVRAMLSACALTPLADRGFLTLSYGQKRLALLARALAARPAWLLLDEFYNGLDRRYRARIDAILERARRRGQSWVAAAHRASDVPPGTTHLMELEGGRLQSARRVARADVARLARSADERPARRIGTLLRKPGRVLLRLEHADLYVDYRPVLRGLNWELRAGEHWALFGANGAGKSSFLKLIYGDLSPAAGGRIERRGLAPGMPIAAWKRRVGYVSPELQTDYTAEVSVLELVASGRYASIGLVDPPSPQDLRAAARWLNFFELGALSARTPRELSYGQLRRALLARALCARPQLLLLDEPLTGLDPAARAEIKRFLERLMQRGVTLIIAVHHAEDLPRGITHGLRLHKRQASLLDSEFAT
jgi:molybdate transport system ATP-binding protein